jgi:hypothetical protein
MVHKLWHECNRFSLKVSKLARRNQVTIWEWEGVGEERKGGKEGKKKKERKTEDRCIREYIGWYGGYIAGSTL